ncbi:hypothetical protein BH10CYA1_BH10CYA1_53550 [soil metagenome]
MFSIAFSWALVAAVTAAIAAALSGKSLARILSNFWAGFVIGFVINYAILYFWQPALMGNWWGKGLLLVTSAVTLLGTALINGLTAEDSEDKLAPFQAILAVAVALAVFAGNGVVYLFNVAGADNAKHLASLLDAKTAKPGELLPKTDPDHLSLVTSKMAYQRARGAIGAGGGNLGSLYMTRLEDYTRQAVRGHLYFVAPLVLRNNNSQLGIGSQRIAASPGYVMVDAEDPNGTLEVKTDHPINFMPNAVLAKNIQRHIYENGFTDGEIDDITLEIDDEFHPFYTAAYLQPAVGTIGRRLVKVIVVDASSGQIVAYDPEKVPQFVDRIYSETVVTDYIDQWGKWGDPRSLSQYPNWADQYMNKAADFELLYAKVEKGNDSPFWIVPVTSNNTSDDSANGILLIDSRTKETTYFNNFVGKMVGDPVRQAFENAPGNLRHYAVESVQLYPIEGVPTWFAIYTQPVGEGSQFAAVGFLNANNVQVSNVVFAQDKQSGLAQYRNQLASGNGNGGSVSSSATIAELQGVISRVSPACGVASGQPGATVQECEILLKHQSRQFTIGMRIYSKVPFVKAGDKVTLKFREAGTSSVAVIEFNDLTIEEESR